MAEHVLHHSQVYPGGQGQRGRAVTQVVQPDRRQPGLGSNFLNILVSRSGAVGSPFRLVNTNPLTRKPGPNAAASARCRSR